MAGIQFLNVFFNAERIGSLYDRFLLALAADLAARIPEATRMAVESTIPTLHQSARALSERLQLFILKTTKKTAARLTTPAPL